MSIHSTATGETSQFIFQPFLQESRQESPSNSETPRWEYGMNHEEDDAGVDGGSKWGIPGSSIGGSSNLKNNISNIWSNADVSFSNAYYRGDGDSYYSSSTLSAREQNHLDFSQRQDGSQRLQAPSFHNPTDDITRSMGQLSMRPPPQDHPYYPSGLVTVPSMASGTSSTVPGVVGASSGSTVGSVATRSNKTWNDPRYSSSHQQLQQQPLFQHPYPRQQQRLYPSESSSLHSGYLGAPPPGFPQQHLVSNDRAGRFHDGSSVNEEDSSVVSFDSRADSHKHYQPRGGGSQQRRNNSKKGKSNRRNNNSNTGGRANNSRGGRGRGGSRRDEGFREGADDGRSKSPTPSLNDDLTAVSSKASSEAIRMLMSAPVSSTASITSSQASGLTGSRLSLDGMAHASGSTRSKSPVPPAARPILPAIDDFYPSAFGDDGEDEGSWGEDAAAGETHNDSPTSKKREWLLRMNRRLNETLVGQLDPSTVPVSAIMNAWAKTKSAQGASMVEMWLKRIQEEADAGNSRVVPTTKMYTMAGKFQAGSNIALLAHCKTRKSSHVSHIFHFS